MNRLVFLLSIILVSTLLLTQTCPLPGAANVTTESMTLTDDDDANTNLLTLVSSSTPNGARNVPLNPYIQLDFNKNIVHFSIAASNAFCYHLVDGNNNSVPINIILPDEQMQPVKRSVIIKPESNLLPETIYTLAVDNTLMSKNGEFIDDAHNITFKTGSQISERTNPLLVSLGMDILTFSVDLPMNENSYPGLSKTSPSQNRPAGNQRFSLNDIDIIPAAQIIMVISLLTLIILTYTRFRIK